MLSNDYIAGLFDGEGSVTIGRHLRHYKLVIAITQKPTKLLLLVQEQFGGTIYQGETASYLRFDKKAEIDRFLEVITPLTHLKRPQLEVAKAFRKCLRNTGDQLTEDDIEERDWFKQEITRLNGRVRDVRPVLPPADFEGGR